MTKIIENKFKDRIEFVVNSFEDYMEHKYKQKIIRNCVENEFRKLVEDAAQIAENWGSAPPDPYGRRARLAQEIRDLVNI